MYENLEKLQNYIAYVRPFNSSIPQDIKLLLKHFLKQMAKSDVDGLLRKFAMSALGTVSYHSTSIAYAFSTDHRNRVLDKCGTEEKSCSLDYYWRPAQPSGPLEKWD